MPKDYPIINGYRRKPNLKLDGTKRYGKPCVVCCKSTAGQKWIQLSYLRGEDEIAYVCFEHWGKPDDIIINLFLINQN